MPSRRWPRSPPGRRRTRGRTGRTVDRKSLEILRAADDIVLQEVERAGLYKKLWQAFAVLLPVRSVGVMGDQRTYHRVVVIRLVQSTDSMTANWYAAPAKLLARMSTRIATRSGASIALSTT